MFDVVCHSLIEFQIDHLEDVKYGADAEQAYKLTMATISWINPAGD